MAALEHVGLRQEVGVEDQDELALGGAQAVVERAGLEAGAVDAVDVLDVELGEAPRQLGDLARQISCVSSVESSSTWIWKRSRG